MSVFHYLECYTFIVVCGRESDKEKLVINIYTESKNKSVVEEKKKVCTVNRIILLIKLKEYETVSLRIA